MQRRRLERLVTSRHVNCRTIAAPYVVTLTDISRAGCSIKSTALRRGEAVLFDLPGVGTIPGEIVWANDQECGAKFWRQLGLDEVEKLAVNSSSLEVPVRLNPTNFAGPRSV